MCTLDPIGARLTPDFLAGADPFLIWERVKFGRGADAVCQLNDTGHSESTPHREALCRTRTGDPFLTMEVLYQLS